jgi:hypothetical protein
MCIASLLVTPVNAAVPRTRSLIGSLEAMSRIVITRWRLGTEVATSLAAIFWDTTITVLSLGTGRRGTILD